MLLAACSSSDSDDSPVATSQNEIHLTTNVTSMPSGTRATTIDNNTALQGKDLKIDAYYDGTGELNILMGHGLHYDSTVEVLGRCRSGTLLLALRRLDDHESGASFTCRHEQFYDFSLTKRSIGVPGGLCCRSYLSYADSKRWQSAPDPQASLRHGEVCYSRSQWHRGENQQHQYQWTENERHMHF